MAGWRVWVCLILQAAPLCTSTPVSPGWCVLRCWVRSRPSLPGLCSGLVAGLVAITPATGFVSPRSALLIGLIAGVPCYWGATGLKRMLNADDSLDVFGVYGVGGMVGSLLTGVFASKTISGVESSVLTQFIGAGSVMLYSLLMTGLVLWITSLFCKFTR